jgi:serine/threonine protein kinase/Tol biopolymer transport system component
VNEPVSNRVIRFGVFELDLRARELRKDRLSTGLPAQSITILAMLLQPPGEVVLREEIRVRLWPNDTVVEFDHSINAAVRRLRVALGDPADQPRYIETLARRGYRWIGPAASVDSSELCDPPSIPALPADPEPQVTITSNLTGKKVSHYRVLEVLGGGGMGVIYRAEDLKLGRRVALKFLPEELASDPDALMRLAQEARAASALNHPNVCTIHEIAEHEGYPFIAMEFLEGETLREFIARSGSPTDVAALEKRIDLAIQISEGLAAAHARGVVHRDIKPANIFLTSGGLAKILDFGVAKHVGPDRVPQSAGEVVPARALDLSLTRTGVTVGTLGYMSPEQIRGELLDVRTDIFSFGLVLYEMMTGGAAFAAETAAMMRDAILNREPVPAREVNAEVPVQLQSIIDKALQKDREARYQTASDMRTHLISSRLIAPVAPQRPRGRVVAGAVALLSTLAVTVFWFRGRPPAAPLPELQLQQLTLNSSENPVTGGSISPDGKYLAYIDAQGINIKLVGGDDVRRVPDPAMVGNEKLVWEMTWEAWFADGTRFLVNGHPAAETRAAWSPRTSSIWMVPVLGGPPRKLRDHAYAWSTSSDGAWVSFSTREGAAHDSALWLMGPDGEQAHKVYAAAGQGGICCLHFFSNGERVSYITEDESGGIFIARDLKGGPVVTLLTPSASKDIREYAWLPDGRLIYPEACYLSRFDTPCNFWIMRIDIHTGDLIEKPKRLTSWAGSSLNDPSTTADGKRVAFRQTSGHGTSYMADLEDGGSSVHNMRHFTMDEYDDAVDDWTPDGGTAIVIRNLGDHYAVYRQNLNSEAADPIVAPTGGGALAAALLTPDAKWVILQVYPSPAAPWAVQPYQIWRAPVSGGPPEYLFTVPAGSEITCAKSPTGVCAVAEPSADRKQIIVSSLDPGTLRRSREILRYDRYQDPDEDAAPLALALSPDGDKLSVSAGPNGPIRIFSLHGGGAKDIPVMGLTNVGPARWTADGKSLIVTDFTVDGAVLMRLDLDGNRKQLWKCVSRNTCFGSPSPDGRHIAISQSNVTSNMWLLEGL